jgi:hypothetical protein
MRLEALAKSRENLLSGDGLHQPSVELSTASLNFF